MSLNDRDTRMKFLNMEIPSIAEFLSGFVFNDPLIKPIIHTGEDGNWIAIENFPLSDDYKQDYEDIAIVTADYPLFGPPGIYVKDISCNISKIQEKMGHSHVYDRDFYKELKNTYDLPGWTWVCFHYRDFEWNFNPTNINEGDNLSKFVYNVYANLCGNYLG